MYILNECNFINRNYRYAGNCFEFLLYRLFLRKATKIFSFVLYNIPRNIKSLMTKFDIKKINADRMDLIRRNQILSLLFPSGLFKHPRRGPAFFDISKFSP